MDAGAGACREAVLKCQEVYEVYRENPFEQFPKDRRDLSKGLETPTINAESLPLKQMLSTLFRWVSSPVILLCGLLKTNRVSVVVKTGIFCLILWIGAVASVPWTPFEAIRPQELFCASSEPQPPIEPAPSQSSSQTEALPLCEIGLFAQEQREQTVGDRLQITIPITPADIPQQEIQVLNSNPDVLQIGPLAFTPKEDRCLLTFQIKAVSVGESQLKVSYGDGEISSNTLTVTVQKQSESASVDSSSTASAQEGIGSTVYITPSGKRYHYSASCGGKNARATTLKEAQDAGKTPCKKCVP